MGDDSNKPFHNPFAVLGNLKGPAAAAPVPAPPAAATPTPGKTPAGKSRPRAVVRLERTRRGGKEVTVVEHLELSPKEREEWMSALKAALGCGGKVEGEALVIQGDQRKRLPAILTARGVKKITVA